MSNKNYILDYLEQFRKGQQYHHKVMIVCIIYLFINGLYVTEPNFLKIKTQNLIEKDKKNLLSKRNKLKNKISLTKDRTALNKKQKELDKTNLLIEKKNGSDKLSKITSSKSIESILITIAFLNDKWKHASVYLSFLIFLFISYAQFKRIRLLKVFVKFLRESKLNYPDTKYGEFGVQGSLFLAPIPDTDFIHLTKSDVVDSLGWKFSNNSRSKIIFIGLLIFVTFQFRLLYQEIYISDLTLSIPVILTILFTSATIIFSYIWLKGNYLIDTYNSENNKINLLERRDFIKISTMVLVPILVPISISIKCFNFHKNFNKLYQKPRYRVFKGEKVQKHFTKVEKKTTNLIIDEKTEDAANYLFNEIKLAFNDPLIYQYGHLFRLVDFLHKILLVLIYKKENTYYIKIKEKFYDVINKNELGKQKTKLWDEEGYKWKTAVIDKKTIKWNQFEIK